MANGAALSQDPWDLATGHTLSELLGVGSGDTPARCVWRRGRLPTSEAEALDAATWLVAEKAMRLRFGPATAKFDIWREAATGPRVLTAAERESLSAFVQPSFGLPGEPGSDEHLLGHVAELVWLMLVSEADGEERTLRNVEAPGMHVTAPGGDGLAVYEDEDGLHFRLWEIKKHTAASGITTTVRRAYGQLDANGARYLAQYTSTGARYSGVLRELYAELVELWVSGAPSAGAGVAVSTSAARVPRKCFSTMHDYFPAFVQEGQLEGLVAGLGDFQTFATRVRSLVWSAL